jgi:hypothetical protein
MQAALALAAVLNLAELEGPNMDHIMRSPHHFSAEPSGLVVNRDTPCGCRDVELESGRKGPDRPELAKTL